MSQIYFSNIFLNYIPFWDLQTHHLRTLKYLFMLWWMEIYNIVKSAGKLIKKKDLMALAWSRISVPWPETEARLWQG